MKDFTDKLYYRVINTALTFFMINFWFLFANSLFITVFFLLELTTENALFYILSLIPTAPAVAASFFAMGRFLEDGDINATQTFFKGYKKNFKSALKYGISQIIIISILGFNYLHLRLTPNLSFLIPLTLALLVGVLLTNLYAYPILVRYHITLKNLWIIAIISLYKHWVRTLLNLVIVVSFLLLFFHYPAIIIVSFASVAPYLIMYISKDVLVEISETYL